jgi:hypothetical protein
MRSNGLARASAKIVAADGHEAPVLGALDVAPAGVQASRARHGAGSSCRLLGA